MDDLTHVLGVELVGSPAPPNPAPVLMGGKPRSPMWPQCVKEVLAAHPKCQACGASEHLNVHHKLPYHLYPQFELDKKNLIVLCETPTHNCHFILGHLMNWTMYNDQVEELVAFFAKCFLNYRKSA